MSTNKRKARSHEDEGDGYHTFFPSSSSDRNTLQAIICQRKTGFTIYRSQQPLGEIPFFSSGG